MKRKELTKEYVDKLLKSERAKIKRKMLSEFEKILNETKEGVEVMIGIDWFELKKRIKEL